MLYLYFLVVLIVLVIFKKDKKHGQLKNVSRDEINDAIDESHNYKIKIPIFKKEAKYNRKIKSSIKLKKDELLKFSFVSEELQFIVTDVYYNIIYKINNPTELNFCTYDNIDNTYKLDEDKNYRIFVRYNPMYNDDFKAIALKYSDFSKVKLDYNSENNEVTILDEANLSTEMEKNSKKVIRDMHSSGHAILDFKYATQYTSFPSNETSHKLEYRASANETIVIIATNKQKMGCENHIFEINTNTKSFNWYPDCDKLFCTFVIDNDINNNIIRIFERTVNVDKDSTIIPFKILIFTKNLAH